MEKFVYAILAISFLLNLFLGFKIYKKKHILTVDAKKLLSEIVSGDALVKIQVLDPSGIMYRSPRG